MLKKLLDIYFGIGRFLLAVYANLKKIGLKLLRWGFIAFIPLLIAWYVVGTISHKWEFRSQDQYTYRGAASIVNDPIDEDVARENIAYLQQNWDTKDSLWFYNTSQGSNLIPYDFFLHLEQPTSQTPFRDNENLNRYRYLPQISTATNPDGLPVGMALDEYDGKKYMGFTCAACHTSQINYRDPNDGVAKAFRIDGGPSAADMEGFLDDLASALETTLFDTDKRTRFENAVLAEGNFANAKELNADLKKFALQIRDYTQINFPVWLEGEQQGVTHYGFARLDAFGRIYNRVLQYIVSAERLKEVIQASVPASLWQASAEQLELVFSGEDQTNLLLRSMQVLTDHKDLVTADQWSQSLSQIRSSIFNPANAPASYPYMWDIAQHDFVQWTGLVSNGGIGPLGRNVGQVIGVFGTLDWQKKPGWSFSSYLGGQGIEKHHINFKSSIDKRNLGRVEQHLRKLWSPQWPAEFGEIDTGNAALGKELFELRCASCHANIDRSDPERRVVANITKLSAIGTDPILALNSTHYRGLSGLIQGEYVEAGSGKIIIEKTQPVASLVKFSTKNVVTSWDPDKWIVRRVAEWVWDFFSALDNNDIEATLRRGNYDPGTTVNPMKPIESYKARALNGIWATAPYLHNGSVPDLYELLLPKRRPGDPDVDAQGNPIEYRSDLFLVGSREFDADKIGFRSSGYVENGFLFDTRIRGNSNAGHEYAAGITADNQGRRFAPLNKAQRYQLLEYIKTL